MIIIIYENFKDMLTLCYCGCSSGVEHNLAKVGVEGSNPFTRSNPG